METIKVIVADDHELLTAGLKMTIDSWENFEVVATANNGQEVLDYIIEAASTNEGEASLRLPNIILMDMQMPVMDGIEATRIIKAKYPTIKVVALTTFDDYEIATRAMKEGCDGFLLKVIKPEQLKLSLISVMNGISVVDKDAMEKMRSRMEAKSGETVAFTDRELQIIRMICKGCTNGEIADELGLSTGTVKNLVSLILSKSFCISRADLTRYAVTNKIAE